MLEQLKPNPKTIVSDLIAGLTVSMVNLAELMGYALVAGVNPIYGLYSGIVAPIVGALTAGSAFMMITLTNETALMTAAMLDSLDGYAQRISENAAPNRKDKSFSVTAATMPSTKPRLWYCMLCICRRICMPTIWLRR